MQTSLSIVVKRGEAHCIKDFLDISYLPQRTKWSFNLLKKKKNNCGNVMLKLVLIGIPYKTQS